MLSSIRTKTKNETELVGGAPLTSSKDLQHAETTRNKMKPATN